MFGTTIALAEKYDYRSEKFRIAYDFLRRTDLIELPDGSIPLGQGIVANIQHYTTSPADVLKFETHDKYFDVQYIVSGSEMLGVADRADLEPDGTYNSPSDISFYKEPTYSGSILLHEGDFIVVGPEEAHKPRCAVEKPSAVKKIVLKVPV
jgi:YhcH/YjgK/YiaL family protein